MGGAHQRQHPFVGRALPPVRPGGEINRAENLLFEELDFSDESTPIALGFYEHLNRFSDKELEAWDYSRRKFSMACGTARSNTAWTPSCWKPSVPEFVAKGQDLSYD